jgi:hypothetical protein
MFRIFKKYESPGQTSVTTDVRQILTSFFALLPSLFDERQFLLRAFHCAHVPKNWFYLSLRNFDVRMLQYTKSHTPSRNVPFLAEERIFHSD